LARTLTILIYHRVLDRPDVLRPHDVDRDQFARQLRVLRRWFKVLPLREGVSRLLDRSLPGRAVAITFDDGYRDNLTNAVPLLEAAGMSATFFVATGSTGRGMMFNDLVTEAVRNCTDEVFALPGLDTDFALGGSLEDRRATLGRILEHVKYLPFDERHAVADAAAEMYGVDTHQDGMMSRDEIRMVADAGMEIGAHTVAHPILLNLDDDAARAEIEMSKSALEEIIDSDVTGFAYPNGKFGRDFGRRDVELARAAGFDYAVATDWASASGDDDVFRLPRISIGLSNGVRAAVTIVKARVSQSLRRWRRAA